MEKESTMKSWAKREVELACKKENPEWDGKSFDYGCACYMSALKAYESLSNDGHSGMSWNITKNILTRLMENKPLLPITEKDFGDSKLIGNSTQCSRMSSLFKHVTEDGTVTYTDVDRCCCVDINNPKSVYYCGMADAIINDIYPIKLPYYPHVGRYKIYTEEFLIDVSNGDYDTMAFLYVLTPSGEKIVLNRYYKFDKERKTEISAEEYQERKNRIKK